jgi:CubicO group peptidase (beta-lactamase class C family)
MFAPPRLHQTAQVDAGPGHHLLAFAARRKDRIRPALIESSPLTVRVVGLRKIFAIFAIQPTQPILAASPMRLRGDGRMATLSAVHFPSAIRSLRGDIMRLAKLILVALLTAPLCAQSIDPKTSASIEAMMKSMAAQGMFQGNLLIAKNGAVQIDRSYGPANIEWKRPMISDAKFRAGSLTKVITATLVLQLAQSGKLDLNKTISDYLPWYRLDTGSTIKVSQLLDHSSGLPSYTNLPDFMHRISRLKLSTKDFAVQYCQPDLLFPPGTSYSYSNTGYFLLGALTEAATGKTYEENVHERVLKPMGMTDTGYAWNQYVLDQWASGYQMQGCENTAAPFAEMSVPFSAGALYTTVGDLNKFNNGLDANTVLNKVYTAELFKPRICEMNCVPVPPLFPKGIHSAYGWDEAFLAVPPVKDRGVGIVSKLGVINGYINYMIRTDDYFVAVLANAAEAYSANIALAVVQILYGSPSNLVTPQMSQITSTQQMICRSGLAATLAQLKATPPKSSSTLSTVGNNFIGTEQQTNVSMDQIDTALALFNLNAMLFPSQSLVYQDLAAGYALKNARLALVSGN